jgi:DNA-binding NtrC family response regulator
MRALFEDMARVADTDLVVHLFGETGTGKERVARALHEASARAPRPFVALNAASISDELFEGEMFGHARGAFTGALAGHDGLVAAAEGGTLFIDEVGELTPRAQCRLLRFLQEREYRRVGETTLRRADVRVLTAANVRLEERVAQGLFREDLLYRLNLAVLCLPPLRQRERDVLLLARAFLLRFADQAGQDCPDVSPAMEAALLGRRWPGNVRELENEMKRYMTFGGKRPLQAEPERKGPSRTAALREARADFERKYLREVLELHGWNRTRAARALGLSRQGLSLRLARLGLARERTHFVSEPEGRL